MEFLINWSRGDTSNIGAVGFSAGGRWTVMEAMRNYNLRPLCPLTR